MPHSTPGLGEIRAKLRVAVLTGHEGWGGASDLEVDYAALVGNRLDCVGLAIFRQLDGAVLGVEVDLVVAEVGVVQSSRAPQVGLGGVGIRDLRVELACDANTASQKTVSLSQDWGASVQPGTGCVLRHITINDLRESDMTGFRRQVETLRLHAGVAKDMPRMVLSGQFGPGSSFGILGDRSDGGGAIDGLLGADDIRQT